MINKYEIEKDASHLRRTLGVGANDPIDVFNIAKQIPKLSVMHYPLGNEISGICIKSEKYNLIAINSGQTLGRQNFTLAHEFYHLFYDQEPGDAICQKSNARSVRERCADCFASYFLLPDFALHAELEKTFGITTDQLPAADYELNLRFLLDTEKKYRLSRNALLVRLEDLGLVTKKPLAFFKKDVKANARAHGYSTALYEQSFGADARRVSGDYINLTEILFSRAVISYALTEELLADAFRDDIAPAEFKEEALAE